ncbi:MULTISPECIES: phytoene desaturase family protein [Exiguobacterium]|uniref:phytoene desaturase family protein n=1 Tax=Exiguobacterium TaxID=33986 RepID=UPI001BEBF2A9|nr:MULTISPECIES: NAD(P)/FAD-dependent oxidoreductase [Exiguobacterium]MCT4782043.1 NAD(P)/FAD-dependent oxidoreductase [Exiguobacterium himgiriensis]
MRIGVIGGGIAGLTAAALAQRSGHEVIVYEASREWGGCAGKFERGEYLFPAGATLGMGFEQGGLHDRVLRHLEETVPVRPLQEVMAVHLFDRTVVYDQDRDRFLRELETKFPIEANQIRAFMKEMWRDFETLRPLFERLLALPFRTLQDVLVAVEGFRPNMVAIAPKLYRPLQKTLARHHLNGTVFEQFIDGILLDSLQTGAKDASHLLASVALSIYHEGAFYVEGGLYQLAHALERALRRDGGKALLGRHITSVKRVSDGWMLTDRRGRLDIVDTVVSAIPLEATSQLLDGHDAETFTRQYRRHLRRSQWGTFSLYVTLPEHVCLDRPLFQQVYTKHLPSGHAFLSMSAGDDMLRTEKPERTVTVSTHVDLSEWIDWKQRVVYEKLEHEWTERLIEAVRIGFPDWTGQANIVLPGGPGAWVKYTKRPNGAVGGYAQTPGQALFHAASYRTDLPHLFVCGDTVFPGAGTIGAMTSGLHVARALGVTL